MANSLEREIEENEVVVISTEFHRARYKPLKWRLVRVSAGFGMSCVTMGTALSVEYLMDGEKCRQEGYMLDLEATEQFQKKYGRFAQRLEDISSVNI